MRSTSIGRTCSVNFFNPKDQEICTQHAPRETARSVIECQRWRSSYQAGKTLHKHVNTDRFPDIFHKLGVWSR